MAALRRIATMTGLTALRVCRSPNDLMWLLILPIVLAYGISMFFSSGSGAGRIPAVVVDEDESLQSQAFIEFLERAQFDIQAASREEAGRGIADGSWEAALVIPKGFGVSVAAGSPQLEVLHGDGRRAGALEAGARTLARAMAAGDSAPGPPIRLEPPRGEDAGGDYARMRSMFGVYLVLALVALLQRAGWLHEDRRGGRLQRTLAFGVPYREALAAHVLAISLIGLIQGICFLAVTGLMGAPWLSAGWMAIALPVTGSLAACAGIAVGVAGFVHKESVMQSIAGGAPSMLGMLGGAFFPLEAAPENIQRLAVVNPFYWAMDALDAGFVYQGAAGQITPFAVLILFGVAGMVIGIQGFRRLET